MTYIPEWPAVILIVCMFLCGFILGYARRLWDRSNVD